MHTGQELLARAKRVIPGGNMFLSKRAEMFLPEQWPAYFSKAKGCKVWDLDGNRIHRHEHYGHRHQYPGLRHPMKSTRPCARRSTPETCRPSIVPEEVYLAETPNRVAPVGGHGALCADRAERPMRSRSASRAPPAGKDKVAFCGYHGWHDWYLAANLGDGGNLDGHLLPGLEPKGVPQDLRGSVLPFNYNNFDELEAIVAAPRHWRHQNGGDAQRGPA